MAKVEQIASLSEGLEAMIRAFRVGEKMGIAMEAKSVRQFIEGLQAMRDQARVLETAADRANWNAKARKEVLEAAIAEGTVQVLPIVPRRTAFASGYDGGAA